MKIIICIFYLFIIWNIYF